MTKKETVIVLFSITLCWSSSYIFIKDLSSAFNAYAYLTLTSGVAGIVLAVLFHRLLKKLDKKTLISGSVLALLIAGNILFEKLALDNLPASAVSALASMNIIIVPLILICRRQFPSRNVVTGIAIILVGLGISGHLQVQGAGLKGILYVFLSCLMMSLYTVFASDYTQESDPLVLTVLQLCVTALIGLVLWLITDPGSFTTINWSLETISYIVIIAFFSKAYAYAMLMFSEKYCSPVTVTIIAATDPIVTLALAILIPSTQGNTELFSAKSLMGACIIALGAIVAGTNFLSGKKAKAGEEPGERYIPEEADENEVIAEAASGNEVIAEAATGNEVIAETAAGTEVLTDGAAADSTKTDYRPSRRYLFQFCISLALTFALLGVSIDVMQYADGYSSVRPENFIPITSGILFGPVASLACGLGNLISDRFSSFGWTTILGFFANFLAAYLPYKLWRAAAGRKIDAHSVRRLLLFVWAALLSCASVAVFLNYGLEIFFDIWQPKLALGIMYNNFLFSLMFGLPLFIVLTSEGSSFSKMAAAYNPYCGLKVLEGLSRYSILIYALQTILMMLNLLLFFMNIHWQNSIVSRVLWIISFVVMLAGCLIPTLSGKTSLSEKTSLSDKSSLSKQST